MLKINLLPAGARQTALSSIEQLHRTPLMWVVVGVMAGLALTLAVPAMLRGQQLRQLQTKIAVLSPRKLELDRLQQFNQQLRSQEEAFQGLRRGQQEWSKRLNTLSDVTPEGVWFTELALDQDKGLVIQGAAIGGGGSEMVSIGRLVQDLKADASFASAVKDIQIESIKRFQEKEMEIVQFTLTCSLVGEPES